MASLLNSQGRCAEFSLDYLKDFAKDNGIPFAANITKTELCKKLARENMIPEAVAPDEECKQIPLARLQYQARLLNIPKPTMYSEANKAELCALIRMKLSSGNVDVQTREILNQMKFAKTIQRGQSCGGFKSVEDAKVRAAQLGLDGFQGLDFGTLCFVIEKELERLQLGGQPYQPLNYIPTKLRRQGLGLKKNTYNRFVIQDEEKLDAVGLSIAMIRPPYRLKKEQILPAAYLSDEENRGMVLVHGVGTGKTFAAINASQVLLRKGIVKQVYVITPTSLQHNFIKQFADYNRDLATDPRYSYFTPQQFSNLVKNKKMECPEDIFLIIDEAHNYRTNIWEQRIKKKDEQAEQNAALADRVLEDDEKKEIDTETYEMTERTVGNRVRAVFKFIKECPQVKKVLLLTATPFVNNIYDIENLVAMVSSKKPRVSKQLLSMEESFPNTCDFHLFSADEEYMKAFPKVNYYPLYYSMSDDYYEVYYNVQKGNMEKLEQSDLFKKGNLNRFYNGVRRASNRIDFQHSDKLSAVIDLIRQDIQANPQVRILLYSSWLEAGLSAVNRELDEMKISSGSITGSMSKLARATVVNRFNNGEYRVLMISKAGGEGLDLKATNKVYILEPTWNDASIQQIIGRAVRRNSHASLPENQRHVDVYNMYLLKPFEAELLRLNNQYSERMLFDPLVIGKYDPEILEPVKKFCQVEVIDSSGARVEFDDTMSIDLYLYKFLRSKQEKLNAYLLYLQEQSGRCYTNIIKSIEREMTRFQDVYQNLGQIQEEEEVIVPLTVTQVTEQVAAMFKLPKATRQVLMDDNIREASPYQIDAQVITVADLPVEVKEKFTAKLMDLKENKKIQFVIKVNKGNYESKENYMGITIFFKKDQRLDADVVVL
jgi:superfamily II DNA or RNA helicase